MQSWISFHKAREEIVSRRLQAFPDYLAALMYVNEQIISSICHGELLSRTISSDGFSMRWTSDQDRHSIPLDANDLIPIQFWLHWQDAAVISMRGSPLDQTDTFASSIDDNFEFRLTEGLRDNGALEGHARGVELVREQLPGGLPPPLGRPALYDEDTIIRSADEALANGAWWYDVLAKFAVQMEGLSPEASRARLRRKLKKLGHEAPKKRKAV